MTALAGWSAIYWLGQMLTRRPTISGYAITGVLVAGLMATAMAIVEVSSALLCRTPGRPAAKWWAPRLAVDFAIGVAGLVLVRSTVHAGWAEGAGGWILGGLVGGLVGPTIIRSRMLTVGRENEAKPIGLGVAYDLVRDFFESKIDEFGAARDATWIEDVVVPAALSHTSPEHHLGRLLTNYVKVRRSLTEPGRKAEVAAIAAALSDAETTAEEKVRQLVAQAQELRAFSLLKSITDLRTLVSVPHQALSKPRSVGGRKPE